MDAGAILGAAVTLALSGIGGIVWLVRLEGRINTESAIREAQIKNAIERQAGYEKRLDESLDRIENALERIMTRLDGKADK